MVRYGSGRMSFTSYGLLMISILQSLTNVPVRGTARLETEHSRYSRRVDPFAQKRTAEPMRTRAEA